MPARDVYAGPAVVLDHRARVTAVRLLLPSAVVSGRSAAVVRGVPLAGLRDDVEITLPAASTAGRVQGVRRAGARSDPGTSSTAAVCR